VLVDDRGSLRTICWQGEPDQRPAPHHRANPKTITDVPRVGAHPYQPDPLTIVEHRGSECWGLLMAERYPPVQIAASSKRPMHGSDPLASGPFATGPKNDGVEQIHNIRRSLRGRCGSEAGFSPATSHLPLRADSAALPSA
jgi:hypothetical protein